MEHLNNMKSQVTKYDTDEETFRKLLSRKHLQNQTLFVYKENLVFSVLDRVASSTPELIKIGVGVDKNYRIPCIEFAKLNFSVLDFI